MEVKERTSKRLQVHSSIALGQYTVYSLSISFESHPDRGLSANASFIGAEFHAAKKQTQWELLERVKSSLPRQFFIAASTRRRAR